jgi:hypothetical protein
VLLGMLQKTGAAKTGTRCARLALQSEAFNCASLGIALFVGAIEPEMHTIHGLNCWSVWTLRAYY